MIFWEIEYVDGETVRQYKSKIDPNNPPKTARVIRLIDDAVTEVEEVEIPSGALPVFAIERVFRDLGGTLLFSVIKIGYNINGVRTMKCYDAANKRWFNKQDLQGSK